MVYVEVLLPLPLNKTFLYSVSPELSQAVKPGVRVLVPFRSRKLTGFVLKIKEEEPKESFPIKSILQVLDESPILTPNFINFIFHLSQISFVPPGELLKAALPPSFLIEEKGSYKLVYKPKKEEIDKKFGPKVEAVKKIIHLFSKKRALSWAYLKKKLDFPGAASLLRRMQALGWLKEEKKIQLKIKKKRSEDLCSRPSQLPLIFWPEKDYEAYFNQIERAIDKREFKYFLLMGAKNRREEFLLSLLKRKSQSQIRVLILWPELSTLGPFLDRIVNLLGSNKVACLHGDLPAKVREINWLRIFQGEIEVVIGTRSAVFAPLPRLDLIYIEEEADEGYFHPSPAYDVRQAARLRAKLEGAVILSGSSAPAVSFFYQAKNQGQLIDLGHPPRKLKILAHPAESSKILNPELQKMISDHLSRQEKVAILINRRGYAPFLICLRCGQIVLCPQCRRALTFYAKKDRLICHQCGFSEKNWRRCPECHHSTLVPKGYGLEAVEEVVKQIWPQAKTKSVEAESFRGKKELASFLKAFSRGQIDIIIGTQFLLPHLPWKEISLAAFLNPEIMLAQPDFRAGERVFSLVRRLQEAMEENGQGEVIIQTAISENYVLQALAKDDYAELVKTELRFRRLLNLPPYRSLIRIILTGPKRRPLGFLAREIKERLAKLPSIEEILGPILLPVSKGKNQIQIWLKGKSKEDMIKALALEIEKHSFFLEIID